MAAGTRMAARAGALAVLAVLGSAFGAGAAPAPEQREVVLAFDELAAGTVVTAAASTGGAPVTVEVVGHGSGEARAVARDAGPGAALRFPAHDPARSASRAVLRVVNAGTADALSPGTRDFTWGADFALDAVSVARSSGSTDNGNNLVQRGLAGQRHQFKLELDAQRPACHLEGSAGTMRLVVPVTVEPGGWYRATCARTGSRLTATLERYDAAGVVVDTVTRTVTRNGGVGTVAWADRRVPLSVGGKLTNQGGLVLGATDQFNGAVDAVVVDIADTAG